MTRTTRGSAGLGGPIRRLLASVLSVGLIAGGLSAVALVGGPASSADAAPGTPGTPQASTVLFSEDFENAPATAPVLLSSYTGATGQKYTADSGWLTGCNGNIVSLNVPYTQLGNCGSTTSSANIRQLAYALGVHAGSANPNANNAVGAYTDNNPGANAIEFQTVTNVPLASASGRFLTFSVDTAAVNCSVSAPQYQFSFLDGAGTATNVGGVINACSSAQTVAVPAVGPQGAQTARVGTYTSNGSLLFTGTSLGIRMRNANGSGTGNDAAFDNVRILDVTPQLDKAFSPTAVSAGGVSTLTFTVTNTSELAAKNGWGFTDTLPAGLTVANPSALGGTCTGTKTAAAGGSSVSIANGSLAAGQASCTITVQVTAAATGSYTNGPGNMTETGLNPPADATLTVTPQPVWTCSTDGYLFQSPNASTHETYSVNVVTGASAKIGDTAATVNAVGYNPTDNYVYGWSNGLPVRIGSDYSLTPLPLPAGVPANVAFNTGDVDGAGHLWVTVSSANAPTNAAWYEIDYASGSATYGQVLASGTFATNTIGSDWSFVGGSLYSITDGTNRLIRFDASSHLVTDLGPLTGVPAGNYGATYADQQYLYISNNATGAIVRVDPATKAVLSLATGPASIGNDGARCATAAIPTITVQKTVVDRAAAADQFTVGLSTASGAVLASATTAGTGTSATTTNYPVEAGATYTITDAMAAGSSSSLDAYTATVVCTDTTTGTVAATGGTKGAWTLTVPNADAFTCVVTNAVAPAPSLSIVKSASPSGAASYTTGTPITYSFVVTNTGNVPVEGVTVADSAFSGTGTLSAIVCPTTTLAAGAATTCTATYELTQADVDAGRLTNTATATATPIGGGDPVTTPPSQVAIPNDPAPAVTLVKSASPTSVGRAGDVITYSFLVTNTGNVSLTDPTVDETAFSGAGTAPAVSCPTGVTLLPGQTATCTAAYTVTQEDVDAGAITNTATASATPPAGAAAPVSDPSTAAVPVTGAPALTLVKSSQLTGAAVVGATVTYSFLVTNTGNVTVADVVVTDTDFSGTGSLGAITCPVTTLAPTASTTCTAGYTLTQADVDAGELTNTATAGGTTPGGDPVASSPSDDEQPLTAAPALSLVKSADPVVVTAAGQTVAYAFLVTNTGNVTLTDPSIAETAFSGSGTPPVAACPTGPLAPGASVTCTASYTVTQADVDGGAITNAATASATPPGDTPAPVSDPSTATVSATPAPGLSIVKSSTLAGTAAAGQSVTYSFLVTNTGNVTLSGIAVTDTDFSGTGDLSAIDCPSTTLAPAAHVTCTASYTLTQADVDAGELTNTATAGGSTPGGDPVTSTPSTNEQPLEPAPALTIVKSAAPAAPADFRAGERITYSFVLTNTGTVTLTDVGVAEGDFTGTGTLPTPTCPEAAASLAPGAQVVCSTVYTVTQADIDAGSITNTATGTGTPPGTETPIGTTPSTVTVPEPAQPGVTLVKTADVQTVTRVGQVVHYAFTVTNTGNTTLAQPTVHEGAFSGAGTLGAVVCPAGSDTLVPGQVVVCAAEYTVVAADLTGTPLTNTATVSATPPGGAPIASDPSTARVTLPDPPAPRPLASTGSTVGWAAGIAGAGALALLVAGGILLIVRRRRTSES